MPGLQSVGAVAPVEQKAPVSQSAHCKAAPSPVALE